ncbi:MAG TPA: pitrilysin family protein [Ignavibacteria bacterium]|nr:pitrilysin family protein [Ignavibacteria bacterium]
MIKIDINEFTLENGLRVVLSKNDRIPLCMISMGFKVGSKNEREGEHGIAHLIEHLMFSGSENVPQGEFDVLLSDKGGESNAYTSHDMTDFQMIIPSNALEFAMWLDSDRYVKFGFSDESIEIQKNVVLEEKLQHVDNSPYGSVEEESSKRLFSDEGYKNTVIGIESDIRNVTPAVLKKFYEKYYNASNAVLTVTGDIDYLRTKALIEKYYGDMPSGEKSNYSFMENEISSEIIFNRKDNVNLSGEFIYYKIPRPGSDEFYAGMVLSGILTSGESSRLYKDLVIDKKLCNDIESFTLGLEYKGIFSIETYINKGADENLARIAIDKVLEEIRSGKITDEEIESIKNKLELGTCFALQTNWNTADRLTKYKLMFNDAGRINTELERIADVNKEDIINLANKFLNNHQRVVLNYYPNEK